MGFLGVYKAIYDYDPQCEGELAIAEGDILYILEKGEEDCWWKAKKKASQVDEEEPVGLIPNNYVEEVYPTSVARALYDYTRQTDEELSFTENSQLDVYDTSDVDWILVGLNGEYGFAPANYIEIGDEELTPQLPSFKSLDRPVVVGEQGRSSFSPNSPLSPVVASTEVCNQRMISATSSVTHTPQASDDESQPPILRNRKSVARTSDKRHKKSRSGSLSPAVEQGPSTPTSHNYTSPKSVDTETETQNPQGFHMYNINEMVSAMGKRKKMPTTLGINHTTGVILIAPEKSRDGPEQRWTAEKMTHYSIEGKHVFLEMVRPVRSVDFHAGAKDTAQEIVGALGELAGAVKAEGLREVILAGSGQSQKKGKMLYDFVAQEDNEVTVEAGDEIIIVDDTASEEWWEIRRLKNNIEGVVPSSYIEITGVISVSSAPAVNVGRSVVEQNRLEEERLAKDSVREGKDSRNPEVGPGLRLPERGSSLSRHESNNIHDIQRQKNDKNETSHLNDPKSKPDPSKVRTWNDRSKSFSVEAQFLALKDGKINLHKMNGVKIAVPVSKMSIEDLEYVERQTGISLDDDKPLSGLKKGRSQDAVGVRETKPGLGATIERPFDKKDYDWFQFFLGCDVSVNLCERYSQAFQRDSIDESVLPDIDATVLRTLGIREGDIIKIIRFLDKKFSRSPAKRGVLSTGTEDAQGSEVDFQGGLFSGPGGALKNNTRKARPAPAIQTSNTINPDAFSQNKKDTSTSEFGETSMKDDKKNRFEDDAWYVKPSKEVSSISTPTIASQSQSNSTVPALTGAIGDLSLLSKPLEPEKLQPKVHANNVQSTQQVSQASQGPLPSLFAGIGPQQTGLLQQQTGPRNVQCSNQIVNGISTTHHQPTPIYPFRNPNQSSFITSAPDRPLSAPSVHPPSLFSLQPQATGIQTSAGYQHPANPLVQNLNDPRILQVTNGLNVPQNQLNNQIPNGIQSSLPQFSIPSGIINQTFKNNGGGPFLSTHPQPFTQISAQSTGFQSTFPQLVNPTTGINSFLPPPLQPTPTGNSPQTGINTSYSAHFHTQNHFQNTLKPLVAQKTGPPPPVKFGVSGEAKKLVTQPTGRRANLSQATPQNPFGF